MEKLKTPAQPKAMEQLFSSNSLPLAGREVIEAALAGEYGNQGQFEFGVLSGCGGDEPPLAESILHGENYVGMNLADAALKWFAGRSLCVCLNGQAGRQANEKTRWGVRALRPTRPTGSQFHSAKLGFTSPAEPGIGPANSGSDKLGLSQSARPAKADVVVAVVGLPVVANGGPTIVRFIVERAATQNTAKRTSPSGNPLYGTDDAASDADRHPDGFNTGINDGMAAGQNVPHAHIHVIPRYDGDVPDSRGGVRWVIPDKAPFRE